MSARLNITTALKGLRWSLPLMIALLPGIATRAQINNSSGIQAASGINNLGTKVGDGDSQTLGGSCNSGHCRISGGTASGSNLFHRLSKLRTNTNIDKITLDNLIPGSKSSAFRSIILSNIDGNGTYINTPFLLDSSSSDLVILSPGGIEIGGLAKFSNVGSLALSTAENLSIGGKIFHYQNSTATDLVNMSAVIDLAQTAFSHNQTQGGEISIKVGELLSIDADLILHSVGGVNIDSASSASNGSLEIGGDLTIASSGQSQLNNGTTSTSSTWIGPVTITANAVSIDANGNDAQPQALMLSGSSITTDDAIVMTGVSADEAVGLNHDDLRGIIINDAELISHNGDILLTGIAGMGNGELNGLDLDISKGSGVFINNSLIDTTTGTIDLKGEGSHGLVLDGSHGVEILGSELNAQKLEAIGIGGRASSEGTIDQSHGIAVSDSDINAGQGVHLNGIAGNSTPDGAELGMVMGVSVETSTLTASAGQVKLTGTGGSGSALEISTGVYLDGSDLRAASLNITGEGGTSSDLNNTSESIGVAITDSNTLDTNSSNDDLGVIPLSDQVTEQSGDVVIEGVGGSGLDDSSGVWSEADIDSGASIQINGRGGNGSADIYGVALEGMPTLQAETSILIDGEGGDGSTILDSSGVYLSEVELIAKSGIRIDGNGGTSNGPTSRNGWLNGVYIEDSTLTVSGREALSGQDNPNQANLIIAGQPGNAQQHILKSAGIIIYDSSISSSGTIWMRGDGRTTQSDILEYGNGILVAGTDLTASSVVLKGYGPSATQTDAVDDNGDLIDQMSIGIELIDSVIVSKRLNNELDGSIELIGSGGSGNSYINGINIYDSALMSDSSIQFKGIGGSATTTIIDGLGILLDSTWLEAQTINLMGVGGAATGSHGDGLAGVAGLAISNSMLAGSNGLTLEGRGGKTTSSTELAFAAAGIGLVDQPSLLSKGLIKLIGTGGAAAGEAYASYGIFLQGATVQTDGDIEITGSGGTGTEVLATTGVGIYPNLEGYVEEYYHYGDSRPEITAGGNMTISGTGGTATVSASETMGINIQEANLMAGNNIKFLGAGGTSELNPDTAGSNQGLYLIGTNIETSGGSITLMGEGGNGGYLITGVAFYDTQITSAKGINVEGNAGSGDNVSFAEGVYGDFSILESKSGDISISGKGGAGTTVEDGHGIYLIDNEITLSNSNKLTMQGEGSEASNQIDSNTNTGITLEGTFINGGSSLTLTGTGGTGGKFNTGLEILETDIETEGTIKLDGTGGKGTNIKAAIGVQIGDASTGSSLVAKSIDITGSGGTSTLKEGAINKDGEDTFQETANNVGVGIYNSSLVSKDEPLSILGTGGNLSIDEITNPDSNEDIEKISTASFLQGINISTSTINSNDALFISGEAGKPIAGNDNSGTSINQSRLTSAATVAIDSSFDNRIEGKAYSGTNNNYGLSIKATDIVSTNQDLDLSGVGGLKASGDNNFGIYIGESSSVAVGSRSNPSVLNIFGAGGNGTNLTGGILTENTSYEIEGSIKMFGESQGAGGFGNASVEFIQNIDIIVSDDASIKGGNDININETNINAGGTTTIDALGNVNITKTNITSGKDTNILADGSIDIAETSVNSGQDTNIQALGNIAIASSQLNAMNNIQLQAESISTMDVEFNAQEVSTISNSILEDNSLSTNDQLELSLSGNVNYSPEEQSEGTNEANTDNQTDEVNESTAKQQQKDEANPSVGSSTKLSATAIQESHDKSEKINSDFVASELGLTRQAPLSIQEVQQMLNSGQQIMNTSRQ